MIEETKKLFGAPWNVTTNMDIFEIRKHGQGFSFAETLNKQDANRLARLPELYDALVEAAAGKCWSCAAENTETMLDHPCPKGHDEDCYVAKWRELLRKVRDGK